MVCEERGGSGLAFALHTHMGCHTIISLSLVLVHTEQGGNKYLLICQIGQIEIYSESIIINL